MRTADYFAASLPAVSAITLADINHIAAIAGAIIGAAYLCWKWRVEKIENDRHAREEHGEN